MKKKSKIILFLVCAVFSASIILVNIYAANYVYYGSPAAHVKPVQEKLKRWGYYDGSVDGKFGAATEKAVKYFQRKNGLTQDGKAGKSTLEKMGLYNLLSSSGSTSAGSSSSSTNSNDVNLIARAVNGEARGEPYEGQVAVAAVILNRVKSSSFPNSVSGVVYQNGAFDAVADGQVNLSPNASCVKAAKDAMNGWDPSGGAIYYYNPKTATNKWIRTRPIIRTIGNHVFCK
ncbi:spore cortex-lytic enzyme [Anaerofustis stercorihominis]|uniref:Spore cortex-lytic enzyme n=2 Tax=Anaerofustis stercorihominis TaxID=214853 RepID=B1C6Q6_9FIRM|nr:spore cortex-lytic enzyme [Anaerofustis stercorihominis]EDS72693.1 spore cortex-lytic enzyme [Anaerofustis stercorihominis DSM 17244]MCQ4794068.1 spore cortex-lytic enzyme [Anaerofustis stercorihominis]RGD74630.1 spore cortex-lytic enzyme [Anaerofustis stercorihominis]